MKPNQNQWNMKLQLEATVSSKGNFSFQLETPVETFSFFPCRIESDNLRSRTSTVKKGKPRGLRWTEGWLWRWVGWERWTESFLGATIKKVDQISSEATPTPDLFMSANKFPLLYKPLWVGFSMAVTCSPSWWYCYHILVLANIPENMFSALHIWSLNSKILRQVLWPPFCRWVNQETEMLSGWETWHSNIQLALPP